MFEAAAARPAGRGGTVYPLAHTQLRPAGQRRERGGCAGPHAGRATLHTGARDGANVLHSAS